VANSGNDVLHGGDGNDALYGFDSGDLIEGRRRKRVCRGGRGNDIVNGGADSDTFLGDAGNDLVNGGAGFDYLYGGAGGDVFVFRRGDSYDSVGFLGRRRRPAAARSRAWGGHLRRVQAKLAGFTYEGAADTVLGSRPASTS
jgi:Ca2+-binding RTX toxin-like protein